MSGKPGRSQKERAIAVYTQLTHISPMLSTRVLYFFYFFFSDCKYLGQSSIFTPKYIFSFNLYLNLNRYDD